MEGMGVKDGCLNCAAQEVALSAVFDVPVIEDVAAQELWESYGLIGVREIEVYVVGNLICAPGSVRECDCCRLPIIYRRSSDSAKGRLVAHAAFRYYQIEGIYQVQAT